ncbi:MAG: methionine--tRNA ligase [Candidatus Altiarchaeales archaeon ex4484_43]|nr:MAG: methionine--tRNA ligase [Candidatus Altiarchaeales archaeon ex4484_43]
MIKERILVTSALPYANGPLHVGHAIGAYIPADVYARYHRLKGNDVLFICGTDEHGTPITVTAEQEGITPKQVVDKYYEVIANAFSKLGISFDNFSRTTRELHYRNSQKFFLKIMEKGFIYKKKVERPYCPRCKRFLPDRFVKGICPYCNAEDQRGDQCEVCGKQLEPHELKNAYCIICHETPEQRETEHWQEWAENIKKPDEWKKYWIEKCRIVHFIGKDNIPFHAIIWPAMVMAHSGLNLPWQISSNEYLTLEGKKMSTSRGWVLWLHEILEEFDPDLVRYYLLSINPEKHDADFSFKEFQDRINNELLATLGNFINRTLTFIKKKGSTVPEVKEFDKLDEKMLEVIREAPSHVGNNIERFKFLDALRELMKLAHFGNEYFQKKEPWKNENSTTLYLCANLTRTLAILMAPFLPYSADRVWRMLNLKGSVLDEAWDSAGELDVRERHKLGEVELLYKKIDDEEIEAFENKILKTSESEEIDHIEFSEFEKLDLRIGKIKEVRDHPRAEKLYLLKVDIGKGDVRQLVAGIKTVYKKEELMGRQVVVVTNLKPREIRGERSDGMILAADVNGKAVLLMPDKKVRVGARVK